MFRSVALRTQGAAQALISPLAGQPHSPMAAKVSSLSAGGTLRFKSVPLVCPFSGKAISPIQTTSYNAMLRLYGLAVTSTDPVDRSSKPNVFVADPKVLWNRRLEITGGKGTTGSVPPFVVQVSLAPAITSSFDFTSIESQIVSLIQRSSPSLTGAVPDEEQVAYFAKIIAEALATIAQPRKILMPAGGIRGLILGEVGTATADIADASIPLDASSSAEELERITQTLNGSQTQVLDVALAGRSMFLGGDAGTGKSFLLKVIVSHLRDRLGLNVAVTGTTGIAALNIGGVTFHSLFGLGPSDGQEGSQGSRRWPTVLKQLDVIVLDEVSMMTVRDLDRLSTMAKQARASKSPFGGIQVILSGDFLQLKAVTPNAETLPLFHSDVFCNGLVHLKLVETMRQANDKEFLSALNALRIGKLPALIANSAVDNPYVENATRLFARRSDASRHNNTMMNGINGPYVVFPARLTCASIPGQASDLASFEWLGKEEHNGLSDANNIATAMSKAAAYVGAYGKLDDSLGELVKSLDQNAFYVVKMKRDTTNKNKQAALAGRNPRFCVRCSISDPTASKDSANNIMRLLLNFLGGNGGAGAHVRLRQPRIANAWQHTSEDDAATASRDVHKHIMDISRGELVRDHSLGAKQLKVGCRVMLLRNMTAKLVNGIQGTVISIEEMDPHSPHFAPIRNLFKKIVVSPSQEVSQKDGEEAVAGPMPFDKPIAMLVPASRLLCPYHLHMAVPVVRFDDGTASYIPFVQLPVESRSGSQAPKPDPAKKVVGKKRSSNISVNVATLPLVPAYAFTVHKIQGLTLTEPIIVDCRGMWPCEHIVYVAASRVKRRDHLRVVGLRASHVIVDPDALEFSVGCPTAADSVAKLNSMSDDQKEVLYPVAEWAQGIGGDLTPKLTAGYNSKQ